MEVKLGCVCIFTQQLYLNVEAMPHFAKRNLK